MENALSSDESETLSSGNEFRLKTYSLNRSFRHVFLTNPLRVLYC